MARKPTRKARSRAATNAAPTKSTAVPPDGREGIVAAFLTLLADKPFEEIDLGDVAAGAGISLAALRGEFSSTFAILAAHMKEIDRAVLASDFSDMTEEPARERLFDVLMRRLEIMAPHRAAVHSLLRSLRRSPPLALAVNSLAVRSQQWMLAAAGIGTAGPRGMVRAQGAAVLFGSVLRTWVDDDDEGKARTMAALDRALGRGQRIIGIVEDLCAIPARLCRIGRRRRRRDEEYDEPVVA